MPRYKRTADEAELDIPLEPEVAPEDVETLTKLRNMWEFAALMEYIHLFGDVVKIDQKFEIETLEAECLKPEASDKLAQIGLQLLKYVSSHRGLTPDIFDEYTRRQYLAKSPNRNPFGDDEEPARFNEFDVFTKVRVLHQLSVWTLGNVDRIRGLMPAEAEQLDWRMEPLGWDKEDRSYFVLDDNRLYRRTDEPPPPPSPKPKAKSKLPPKKPKSRGTRTSKRRKLESSDDELDEVKDEVAVDVKDGDDVKMTNGTHEAEDEEPGYGFTSKTWECIAVTLDDYNDFLATIFRTRDPNERHLRKSIEEGVIPVIEERAERIRNQKLKELRDLEVQAQMATAKRSGRLAEKQERDRLDKEQRDAEEKKRNELREAHAEEDRLRRVEEGHESRRQTREQRLKEREMKRILHEEQLAKLEEEATRASSQDPSLDPTEAGGAKRVSNRQNKTEREKHRKELALLAEDEDNWYFDCVKCHKHGDNFDDGAHSIACEKCNVWQHSACHGIKPEQAEDEDFHFICSRCKQNEADAKKPKIAPLKLGKNRTSSSPQETKTSNRPTSSTNSNGTPKALLPEHVTRQLDGVHMQPYPQQYQPAGPFAPMTNPLALQAHRYPPVGNFAPRPQQFSPPQQAWNGNPLPPPQRPSSSGYAGSPPPHMANGQGSPQRQHQQQHQNMHHQALNVAGGHPPYQYPPPSPNGYSPRTPAGMYPAPQHSQAPQLPQAPHQQQQYHYYHPPPQHYHAQAPPPQQQHYQQQYIQRQGSQGQLMNGFQSPVNSHAKPANASPPVQQQEPHPPRRPSYGHVQHPYRAAQSPQLPVSQHHSGFAGTPAVNFPPQQQHSAQHVPSPVKSSPPPPGQQYSYQPFQPTPRPAAQTPTATPQSQLNPSNDTGQPFQHQTPLLAPSPKTSPPQATSVPVKKVPASAPHPEQLPTVPAMPEVPQIAKPAVEVNGNKEERP